MTAAIKRDRPIVDQSGRLTQYGWGVLQSLWRATGGAQEADGTELKATVFHIPREPDSQEIEPSPLPSMGEPDRTDPVPRSATPDTVLNLTILEELAHEGSSLGFFGATPVSQQTAPASLTDNSGGSKDDVIEAVGNTSTGDQSGPINNNFAEITEEINQIRTLLTNLGLGS